MPFSVSIIKDMVLFLFLSRPLSEVGEAVFIPMLPIRDLVTLLETCKLLSQSKAIRNRLHSLVSDYVAKNNGVLMMTRIALQSIQCPSLLCQVQYQWIKRIQKVAKIDTTECLHRCIHDVVELTRTSDVPGMRVHSFDGLLNFSVTLYIDKGPFRSQEFHYTVRVPYNFPFSPPRVRCLNPPFHPQYGQTGIVGFLQDNADWAPFMTLTKVFLVLKSQFLTRAGILDCCENLCNPDAYDMCLMEWKKFLLVCGVFS